MTQDEVFTNAKSLAVPLNLLIANPITERLPPLAGAFSLGLGFVTGGRVPRSHDNLLAGANAICQARKKGEHPNILAWQISSNQIRNNLIGLRVLARNDTFPVTLIMPPKTRIIIEGKSPIMVVSPHSLGDIATMPKINEVFKSRGVLIAAAPQQDTVMNKLTSRAGKYGLTIEQTSDPVTFGLHCARFIKKGGVIFLHEGTRPNPNEPMIEVNFLDMQVLLRENIYRLAAGLKIPIISALSTIKGNRIEVATGLPIQTSGREIRTIAQDWANSTTELTKQYPTSNLAFFELELKKARR